MNDPLRDNRIFPEEMHQKALPRESAPKLTWLWAIIGILLLALLGWYIYRMYNASPGDELPSVEEQERFFEDIKNSSGQYTPEEHDQQVNNFLGVDNQ